jgi:hypothetical protein
MHFARGTVRDLARRALGLLHLHRLDVVNFARGGGF